MSHFRKWLAEVRRRLFAGKALNLWSSSSPAVRTTLSDFERRKLRGDFPY